MVSDDGLSHLKGLKDLKQLSLTNTKVTDAGLTHLVGLAKLDKLLLKGTRVTPASVAALQKALPNCKIEWDDPTKAKTPQPAASGMK